MARVSEMLFPMLILLFALNSIFLFIIYLPANETQLFGTTAWRANQYAVDSNGLGSTLIGLTGDANAVFQVQSGEGAATVTEHTNPNAIASWIYGATGATIGCVLGFVAGGAIGCVTGAVGLGLIGYFWQYVSIFAFGYFLWIDFLINPNWGTGFYYLGLGIKSLFFLVVIIGLLQILIPAFSAWRK